MSMACRLSDQERCEQAVEFCRGALALQWQACGKMPLPRQRPVAGRHGHLRRWAVVLGTRPPGGAGGWSVCFPGPWQRHGRPPGPISHDRWRDGPGAMIEPRMAWNRLTGGTGRIMSARGASHVE